MRLQRGGAYREDIENLRRKIRANGTKAHLEQVLVTHPDTKSTAYMHINLAYEPNSAMAPINGSLYTVAFENASGTWSFNVGAIGVQLPGVPSKLDGSYASLGYPGGLPSITYVGLQSAIESIANQDDPYVMRSSMALLLIAVNEAIRFDEVAAGVASVLGNNSSYTPSVDLIRSWGGHRLGG